MLSPLQVGIPYSRPRYFALAYRPNAMPAAMHPLDTPPPHDFHTAADAHAANELAPAMTHMLSEMGEPINASAGLHLGLPGVVLYMQRAASPAMHLGTLSRRLSFALTTSFHV